MKCANCKTPCEPGWVYCPGCGQATESQPLLALLQHCKRHADEQQKRADAVGPGRQKTGRQQSADRWRGREDALRKLLEETGVIAKAETQTEEDS